MCMYKTYIVSIHRKLCGRLAKNFFFFEHFIAIIIARSLFPLAEEKFFGNFGNEEVFRNVCRREIDSRFIIIYEES